MAFIICRFCRHPQKETVESTSLAGSPLESRDRSKSWARLSASSFAAMAGLGAPLSAQLGRREVRGGGKLPCCQKWLRVRQQHNLLWPLDHPSVQNAFLRCPGVAKWGGGLFQAHQLRGSKGRQKANTHFWGALLWMVAKSRNRTTVQKPSGTGIPCKYQQTMVSTMVS